MMNKSNKIVLISLFLFVFIAWVTFPFILELLGKDNPASGLFGDSFGALNTLFSGLAFAGIIYTILLQQDQLFMQKEELELQRKELEMTRQELTRSAIAQEKSENALRIQIEKMELSAKLDAISSLLNTYNDFANKESGQVWNYREQAKQKAKYYLDKLEEISKDLIK